MMLIVDLATEIGMSATELIRAVGNRAHCSCLVNDISGHGNLREIDKEQRKAAGIQSKCDQIIMNR